jgi:hypothetical protein
MMFVYMTLIILYLVVLGRRARGALPRCGEGGAVITTTTEPSPPDQRSASAVPLKSSLYAPTMRLSPAGSRAGEGRWS